MSTRMKILTASLIAFTVGVGSGRLLPPATAVVDRGLEWERVGDAVRLTAKPNSGTYAVYQWSSDAAPLKDAASLKKVEAMGDSVVIRADPKNPALVFQAVLYCPGCEDCVGGSCESPPRPPTGIDEWTLFP